MKIRTKMISLLALLFAVLTLLDIAIQTRVLLPSFTELEREAARTSMKRIDYALATTLDGLQASAADWGNWADVYQFVQSPDPDFVRANITPIAFKQLQINALCIVDRDGNLVLAEAREFNTDARLSLDLVDAKTLPANFPWLRNRAGGKAARGLLRTNRGVLLIASAPILDGSGMGPSRGMVIMGRLLTAAQLHQLGVQAEAELSMLPTPVRAGDGGGLGARLTETAAVIQVDRTFADIYGEPVMSLRVEVPREISQHGSRAITYACVYLVGAGVAALLLLVVILNRVVLAPLAQVTRHALIIGEGADLTARLDLPGSDEIALLAHEFDRMVERVADSRRELVDQSFAAGFAEVAKGVMHNVGNALTPLGVRLAKLGDALRAAPVADVELAALELGAATVDPARRADLEELLRLGAAELGNALKAASIDVAVIQRQTVIVQTALSELMHATRSEHVVESVRLPELVTQTLEIVPDSCRQRLVVEADESLRRVGVVHVARTVLRLVLQNLIINAADSVRDAGRDKGVLRVAAEIVQDADRKQLHLRCEDNGIGIAKDHLERVFDPGFSTKSRATNHGIGLHWCAGAIAALGGRIWAASEGPGLGACLHLVLPLTTQDRRSVA
jgi:two-component system NtrC family sensor kinase